jgi:hypothetical protein
MEIIDTIEKAHYVANEREVELLAAAHLACSEAAKKTDGAYLRILIAALQAEFGVKKHKLSQKDTHRHAEVLAEVHTRLYPAVMRGVTTPEVEDDEHLGIDERRARAAIRNARATFARSAASTLKGFIDAGGDVRGLDLQEVTKSALRTFMLAKAGVPPKMELVMAALHRVEKQVLKWVQEDPDQARAAIEECINRLQKLHDELPHHLQAPDLKPKAKTANVH